MKLKQFFRYQEFKWVYWLAAVFVLAGLWRILWNSGVTVSWWQRFYGTLDDAVFFRWEEFLALNSHRNTFIAGAGFTLTFVLGLLLELSGRLSKRANWCILVIAVMAAFMHLPCLCRGREATQRIFCQSRLKGLGVALTAYAGTYGEFPCDLQVTMPDGAPLAESDHYFDLKKMIYHGAGKKPSDGTFLLVEDPFRNHAGDLRHRLNSKGTVSAAHDWKANSP